MLTGRARLPARQCRACSEEVNFLAGPTPASSCSARTSSGRPGAGSAPRLDVISRSGSWIGLLERAPEWTLKVAHGAFHAASRELAAALIFLNFVGRMRDLDT